DLERRNAERLANLLIRVPHLLDKLRIGSLERKRGELQVCANDRDLSGLLSGELRIEEFLQLVRVTLIQTGRPGNQAAGVRCILKERRTVPQDADVLSGRNRSSK